MSVSRHRLLPLDALHRRHGAAFETVAGWEIPSCYGDPLDEYAACRTAVGLSDFSHLGRVLIGGTDRRAFLNRLLTRDAEGIDPGDGISACLLTDRGTLRADVFVYDRGDALLCLLRPEGVEAFVAAAGDHLPHGDASVEDLTDAGGLWFLTGPGHRELLDAVWPGFAAAPDRARTYTWDGEDVDVLPYPPETRSDHLLHWRGTKPAAVVSRIIDAGMARGLRLVGRQAQEILRVEAGRPLVGTDVSDEHFPSDVGFEEALDLDKTGHIGADALRRHVRDDTGGAPRLVGARSAEALPVHTPVRTASGIDGRVTSSVTSPQVGGGLSLVLLEHAPRADDEVMADLAGRRLTRISLPVES